MSRLFLTKILYAWLLVLLANPVVRAGDAKDAKAFVIVVGISDYIDKQIQPRRHAEADARALYDLLSRKEILGTEPKNVQLLLGRPDDSRSSQPATRANILKALKVATKQARRDDLVFFAFFGRGGGAGKRVGLFGVDADAAKPADSALALDDLAEFTKGLASQRVCAFLDIHLGGYAQSDKLLLEADVTDVVRMFLGDDRVWGYIPPIGRTMFMPINPMKAPLELKQNGAMAQALIEALQGAADTDGYEPDGLILASELERYLKTAVPRLAREQGQTKDEKDFHLGAYAGRFAHFTLLRNPTAAAETAKQQEQLAIVPALPRDVVAEGQRLLARMPRTKSLQDLRKSYQNVAAQKVSAKEFLKERDTLLTRLALPKAEGQSFARSLMQAVDLIRKHFHEEVAAGALVASALHGLFQELDEPLPAAIRDGLGEPTKLSDGDLRELVSDARIQLGKREDLADKKDLDIALRHMTQEMRDKYTRYYDAAEAKRLLDSNTGKFAGIGVQIRRDFGLSGTRVLSAFKDGPAYKAGLRGSDLIVSVHRTVDSEGKRLPKPETISTKDLDLPDVVKLLLGKPGTKVKVGAIKTGETTASEFEVERDWVLLESVVGMKRKADDSWDFMLDPKSGIAYVRLIEFSGTSSDDLKKTLTQLKDQGMKALIFDLRYNPGGVMRVAIEIADQFVSNGTIVTVKSRTAPDTKSLATGAGRDSRFPMACLINEYSASSSEIVAACLQDHRRARIIGERSYGKGTVAGVLEYPPTKAIFTISKASFWRPNGKNLNRFTTKGSDDEDWGVKPDDEFLVKLTNKERLDLFENLRNNEYILRPGAKTETPTSAFRDRQLESALEYLRSQLK